MDIYQFCAGGSKRLCLEAQNQPINYHPWLISDKPVLTPCASHLPPHSFIPTLPGLQFPHFHVSCLTLTTRPWLALCSCSLERCLPTLCWVRSSWNMHLTQGRGGQGRSSGVPFRFSLSLSAGSKAESDLGNKNIHSPAQMDSEDDFVLSHVTPRLEVPMQEKEEAHSWQLTN